MYLNSGFECGAGSKIQGDQKVCELDYSTKKHEKYFKQIK
jgi:hypothetical protein